MAMHVPRTLARIVGCVLTMIWVMSAPATTYSLERIVWQVSIHWYKYIYSFQLVMYIFSAWLHMPSYWLVHFFIVQSHQRPSANHLLRRWIEPNHLSSSSNQVDFIEVYIFVGFLGTQVLQDSPYSGQSFSLPTNTSHHIDTVMVDGWVLVQQSMLGGSLTFVRKWLGYKNGFSDKSGNYWIGNENLHQLTSFAQWKLRIEVQARDTKIWYSAEYSSILISDESDFYRIQLSNYSGGTAGDAFQDVPVGNYETNGQPFTTFDADHDLDTFNCAAGTGGWWFRKCGMSCLNGCKYGVSGIGGAWGTLQYRYSTTISQFSSPTWDISGSRMTIRQFDCSSHIWFDTVKLGDLTYQYSVTIGN